MKERKEESSKTVNKGFTLIELLVVVLIIGILAAIALPQYKRAVGKAKLASIKNATDAIVNAEQRYYLINNEYTEDLTVLDIEIPVNANCSFGSPYTAYCVINIFGTNVQYARSADSKNKYWRRCIAKSRNENDTANQVCKDDTGDNARKPDGVDFIYYNYDGLNW